MSDERTSAGVAARIMAWATRPLSFYWTLAGIVLCAPVVQTIRTGEISREGFTAAATIAGVARLLAQVRPGRLRSARR